MAVVIIAPSTDTHARTIAWGLEQIGCQVIWWRGLGWEAKEQAAIYNDSAGTSVWLGEHQLSASDTVWFRRPQLVSVSPSVVPDDLKFCSQEGSAFNDTLMQHIELSGVRCVNKWSAGLRIENKSLQLVFAQQSGLMIPSTVMTNKRFHVELLQRAAQGALVHKAFYPHVWVDQVAGETYNCQTSILGDVADYDPGVFLLAPGIYQQCISKKADVRVTVLGERILAYELTTVKGVLDWRVDSLLQKVAVRTIDTPQSLQACILRFLRLAGLEFGCLDFAIDESGDWWFLEVNQAGQFLWIDDYLPEEGLYRPMVEFLSENQLNKSRNAPSFAEARKSVTIVAPTELLTDANPFGTVERSGEQLVT